MSGYPHQAGMFDSLMDVSRLGETARPATRHVLEVATGAVKERTPLSYVPSSVVTRRFIRRLYAFSTVAALLSLLAAAQFDARVQVIAEPLPTAGQRRRLLADDRRFLGARGTLPFG